MFDCLLKDQVQSCWICPSFPGKRVLLNHLPYQNRHLSAVIDGILHVWFLQEEQRPLVVVTPLELRQRRRDRIQFQGSDVTVPPITPCCPPPTHPSFTLRQ